MNLGIFSISVNFYDVRNPLSPRQAVSIGSVPAYSAHGK
jgi:hypothetical protein